MTDKAVILVHGGFVDGSGWEGVYKILKKDGYDVTIVQNPTTSLAADVAATKMAIAAQTKPVILVCHSYGGVVITEAGTDSKVDSLVYVTAFAPDSGECAVFDDRERLLFVKTVTVKRLAFPDPNELMVADCKRSK